MLVFVVALTVTDTNYGKEDTVVPPKDLVRTVGEKNAVHAGPGARAEAGQPDDDATVGQISDVHEAGDMHDSDPTRMESAKKW